MTEAPSSSRKGLLMYQGRNVQVYLLNGGVLRGEYQRKTTKGLSQSGSCHQHQACTQLTDFRFQEVFHLPSGEPGEHRYSSYQAEGLVASFREAGKFRHGLPKVTLVRLSRHPQARKPRRIVYGRYAAASASA